MDIIPIIEKALKDKFGSWSYKTFAAAEYGVSVQFISMMLSGKKAIPERILSDLGYKKVVAISYEKIEKEEKQLDWVGEV